MAEDLKQRWKSPIGVGDFVFISYGLPSGDYDKTDYDENRKIDEVVYEGKNYNSTLWEKIYTEKEQSGNNELTGVEFLYLDKNYGLGYKLVASLTGETPRIVIVDDINTRPERVLHANEDPYVTVDNNNTDYPQITFHLPRSQVLQMNATTNKPGLSLVPSFNYDEQDIDRPILNFTMPEMWDIDVSDEPIHLPPNEHPKVSIRTLEDNQTKEITFSLPNAQMLNTDIITQIVGPLISPEVSLSDDPQLPQLTFKLPRAVKFHYGDLLGKTSKKVYILEKTEVPNVENMAIGDYYLNKNMGFIYLISSIDETTITFNYEGDIARPDPKVKTAPIDPYTPEGEKTEISVESVYDDPVEKVGLTHSFKIPNLPIFTASYTKVGSDKIGSLVAKAEEGKTDTFAFNFKIPEGSQWFVGEEVNDNKLTASIEGAMSGDYYLYTVQNMEDPFRGNIYRFDGNSWINIHRNIEGPVGDALNIKAIHKFNEVENGPDTIENISILLQKIYPEGISPDELLAVSYTHTDKGEISYWCFYINERWERVLLTGGMAGLLQNQYDPTGDINKTYTSAYINKLLLNEVLPSEKEYKSYNAKTLDQKFEDIGTNVNERLSQVETNISKIQQTINQNSEDIIQIKENITWGNIADLIK